MQTGDHKEALATARQTLQTHPKQTKILQTVYDLELNNVLALCDDVNKTKVGCLLSVALLVIRLKLWVNSNIG